jgi:hypothetical protein
MRLAAALLFRQVLLLLMLPLPLLLLIAVGLHD